MKDQDKNDAMMPHPAHEPGDRAVLPRPEMSSIERISNAIDQISIWSGKTVAWLIFPMFLVLFYEVLVRKFWRPTIWANDAATMAYGAHFFIAAAYTLYLQKHIRTDFLSQRWSLKTQVRLDIAQYLLFFLPGMVMFFWLSWDFAREFMGAAGIAHDYVAPARLLVQGCDPAQRRAPPATRDFRGHQVLQDAAHRHRLSARSGTR